MAAPLQPRKKVTRDEVAKKAGVSSAVVSYVVNNGPRPVAKHTRRKVIEAIDALGYQPNATARALRLGATATYGIVVPDVDHSFHASVIHAVDLELSRRNLSLLLSNTHNSAQHEMAVVRDMISRGIDGLIVLISSLSDSDWAGEDLPVPTVLLDRNVGLDGFTTVGSDFVEGGRLATQHLIEHGHASIQPVFGTIAAGETNGRYTGYLEALSTASLSDLPPIHSEWTAHGGYTAGKNFLKLRNMPSAVFCFSDAIAVGFQTALLEAGVRIPHDVALVGFDGTSSVRYIFPTITSVRQATDEIARFTVETVTQTASLNVTQHKTFPVSLQLGHSCGC